MPFGHSFAAGGRRFGWRRILSKLKFPWSPFLTVLLVLSVLSCSDPGSELPDQGVGAVDGPTHPVADGPSSLVSEFVSPQGRAPGHTVAEEGPWTVRLMTALSDDGKTFTRTNTVLMDQANVPDLIRKDGTIYLYFTGGVLGDLENITAVMISQDEGVTWTNHHLNVSGVVGDAPQFIGVDPDVVLLPDGTIRLYFTMGVGKPPLLSIYYADSKDGLNFAYKGVAFEKGTESLLDSTTYFWDGKWHMITLGGNYATSTDGTNFSYQSKLDLRTPGQPSFPLVASNPVAFDDTLWLYGFDLGNGKLHSLSSTDGANWQPNEYTHLELDTSKGLESEMVKDPALIELANGKILMVYVTRIP